MSATKLICVASLVTLAACATDGSDPEPAADRASAGRALSAVDASFEVAARSITPRANLAAPVTGTVSVSVPCARGGDIGLAGSFDTASAKTSFDVTAAFHGCAESEGALDGSLHWTSKVSGASVEDTWTGAVDFTDATGAYHCAFDLRLVVDGAGVHYSGSVCGYDVATELGWGR